MFHGDDQISRQEQTSELILEILGDIQSRLATIQEKQDEMERKQVAMDIKQDRLREMVKVLASAISPDIIEESATTSLPSVPSIQALPPVPSIPAPASEPLSEVLGPSKAQPPSAKVMAGSDSGTYLLGGSETRVRSVDEYNTMLKEVHQRRRNASDNEKGKLLCVCLLKREIPKDELAIKNVTGNSRDENNKRCKIPQLDRDIINCIFHQTKMQFPAFSDWYTDSKSKTVEALNECCKRARYERRKRLLVGNLQ